MVVYPLLYFQYGYSINFLEACYALMNCQRFPILKEDNMKGGAAVFEIFY
jgi:hypothetical protein